MRGLRLVVTTDDVEAALRLYRDRLGMVEQWSQDSPTGRAVILDAGVATLELGDPTHAATVDGLEVGRRVAGHLRVALQVDDVPAALDAALRTGATQVAPPTPTPWGSLNARLDAAAGLHLTLWSDAVRPALTRVDGPVQLVEPEPGWAEHGARLAADVRAALVPAEVLVAHVGSTAVPDLPAKPVLDLLLAVADPTDEEAYVPALAGLGYRLRLREPEWHEHRLLKGTDPAVNLHVFALDSVEVERMLAFRDHLRRDRRDRELYAATKAELAGRSWQTVQDYADAKSDVVRQILDRALSQPAPTTGVVVVTGRERDAQAAELAAGLRLPLLRPDVLVAAGVDPSLAAGAVHRLAADLGAAVVTGTDRAAASAAAGSIHGPVVEVVADGGPDVPRLVRGVRHRLLARSEA